MIPAPVSARRRSLALLALVMLVALPAAWVAWSLHAASVVEETIAGQAGLLAGLKERLAGLGAGPDGEGTKVELASIYLPGDTTAIAGAALQKTVAEKVQDAGGRVLESEFAAVTALEEQEPGRVDLRVAFDAEIASLQRILFELETMAPIVFVRTLSVQSNRSNDLAPDASPPLRVTMLVGAYSEAAEGAQ